MKILSNILETFKFPKKSLNNFNSIKNFCNKKYRIYENIANILNFPKYLLLKNRISMYENNLKNLTKLLINFGLLYLFYNFGDKYVSSTTSESYLQCYRLKFWERNKEGKIELNNLQKRAVALQHNANEPIEDRYSAVELKNFEGYFLSVLDGHGGPQLAEFANTKLYRYFDGFYKEIKESEQGSKMQEDDLVVSALMKTFEKVEKEFYEVAIDLYRKGEGRLATVGSCVTIVIVSNNKIYSAQLGDSKAKLFRSNREQENGFEVVKLTNTHNAEKKREQAILFKEFPDKDIVVCKRPNNTVCYVKGRLQPTRVIKKKI